MGEFFASGTHWRIFNFVVFLVVLFFVLRRPVREFWTNRAHRISFEIDEAAKQKQETRERHDALQKRLARIEGEMADLIRSWSATASSSERSSLPTRNSLQNV